MFAAGSLLGPHHKAGSEVYKSICVSFKMVGLARFAVDCELGYGILVPQ